MPKIITEEERRQVFDAIYDATIELIRQKGVRKITVDEITSAVGISKGAFYHYYPSKEICLYEVLRKNEGELFSRMEWIMAQDMRDKERNIQFLRDVFLASDSILQYLSPTDLEVLLRKLPPEYRLREKKKSDNYFQRSMELLKVSSDKMEAVALLTDCLSTVATNTEFTEKGKQQALDILITAIAEYLSKEETI